MALGPGTGVTLHPELSSFTYRLALEDSRNSYPVGQLTKQPDQLEEFLSESWEGHLTALASIAVLKYAHSTVGSLICSK